ncbi:MAG: hypothetical protein HYW05_05120 [Candidatus Diapherotrites archaeon]|nr:hypothetical protein [Candidatus Diapherotrites archaeon]
MKQKYFWILGIVIVLVIAGIILIIPYIKEDSTGGVPIFGIVSLTSSGRNYATAVINEPINFETKIAPTPNGTIFRLVLPQGVEYVSGDFELKNGELLLEGGGLEGENVRQNTNYDFVIKGTSEGKHSIQIWAGAEDKPGLSGMTYKIEGRDYRFWEFKIATLCAAETLEKATELCVQIEGTCETLECVQERMKGAGTVE